MTHMLLIIGIHIYGTQHCTVPDKLRLNILVYCYYIGNKKTFNAEHKYWQDKLHLSSPTQDTAADHHSPAPPQDSLSLATATPPAIHRESVLKLRGSSYRNSIENMSGLEEADLVPGRDWNRPTNGKNEVGTRVMGRGPGADR